jgi:hypothetical protein
VFVHDMGSIACSLSCRHAECARQYAYNSDFPA